MLYYNRETQKRLLHRAMITIGSVFLLTFSAIIIKSSIPSSSISQDKPGVINTISETKTPDTTEKTTNTADAASASNDVNAKLYSVLSITDGDTIRIDYDGTSTPLRIIGIDTPETVDERTTVQCFGQEATNYLTKMLTGKKVTIEADPTQSDRDKYDRLLRYVYLDGKDVGLSIISNGYGHEYTYNVPYQKQSEYQAAEKQAETKELGLWSPSTCNGSTIKPSTSTNTTPQTETPKESTTPAPQQTTECVIKGNVSNKGEKIYHVPGQQYYDVTVITPSKGERYFCTEAEAQAAGWRKAKV